MTDIDPQYEKKVLREVAEQMKDPDETLHKQTKIRRIIHLVGYIGLLIAFFLAMNEISHPFFSAMLAALSGCFTGFGILFQVTQKQWPVTQKHVNMDSVRQRLDELES